ncbi:MAG: hypothetical protein WD850_01220 [Candidatus Spechtbacterales bacterium]
MDDPRELALVSFRQNRKEAQERLQALKRRQHPGRHRFWCRISGCRNREREVREVEDRIGRYQRAEEGIERGDMGPAIELLDHLIPLLYEHPFEAARRIAEQPPTLSTILSSPTGMRVRTERLRADLVALQEGGA